MMTTIKSQKTARKTRSTNAVQVAIGFRVKSGRAIAVVLAGPPGSPEVLARREIQLCDPTVPDSMQPYHAALDMPGQKAARVIERLVTVVRRATSASVADLVNEWRSAGHEIRCAGMIVGSLIDPAAIKERSHTRARVGGPVVSGFGSRSAREE